MGPTGFNNVYSPTLGLLPAVEFARASNQM
jgi:hypothetical protein